MPKIMPCLWFDDRIEEAVNFYIQTFKDGEIRKTDRYPDGRILTMHFRLRDQEFMALNGGPMFKFNEAVSFSVDCKDQAEVDHLWNTLTADGGEESQCGWLKDKYGSPGRSSPRRCRARSTAATGRAPAAPWRRCCRCARSSSPISRRPTRAPEPAQLNRCGSRSSSRGSPLSQIRTLSSLSAWPSRRSTHLRNALPASSIRGGSKSG